MRNLKFLKFKNIFFKNVKNAEKKKIRDGKNELKKLKIWAWLKLKNIERLQLIGEGGSEIGLFPFNIFPPW